MTLIQLLFAILATAVLVWLVQQNKIPAPFHWVVYLVLVVVWIYVLLMLTGVANLSTLRVGDT